MSWASPVLAHNAFTASTPKDGAQVTQAPSTVTLRFLARLDPTTTTVRVAGPDGTDATRGRPAVKGNRVTIGVRPGPAGGYTVTYQVASLDGHHVKGRIRFTAKQDAPAATASAATAPSAATPSSAIPGAATPSAGAGAPAAQPATPAAPQPARTGPWLWVSGVVVLLVAATAGILLVRRRAAT